MRPVRGAAGATLAVLLVTGALLVLLTWAASTGPDELLHSDPGGTARSTQATATPAPTSTPSQGPRPDPLQEALDRPTGTSLLGIAVAVVGSLALAWVAFRIGRGAWRSWREREVASADPEEVAFEPLSPVAMAREMSADAAEQRDLLTGGTPRNGIVQCWDRFEQVAARVGLAREAWETPAEFTLRFFDLLEADARPVQRLATLYREARFSDHELSEADRDTAAEALGAIHESLRRHDLTARP